MNDPKLLIASLVGMPEYGALCDMLDGVEKGFYESLTETRLADADLLKKTRFWQAFRLLANIIKMAPGNFRTEIELEMSKEEDRSAFDPRVPFSRVPEYDEG